MGNGVGVVVGRLRARRGEIEEAIFARVRDVVSDPVSDAVAAAVEYGLRGIERREGGPVSVPVEAVAQAHRAARNGVSLDAVLRRYMVGQALLWDYILEEADRVELAGEGGGLREILRVQASLLDGLAAAVTREHGGELERAGRSGEQRLLERVRMLLGGEGGDAIELGYELDAEHLGVIVRGRGCQEALRGLAEGLDRRLLSVTRGQGTIWAWLGSQRDLQVGDLERVLSAQTSSLGDSSGVTEGVFVDVSFAVGEPGRGVEGWRLTHRQAQAALVVALRRPQRFTRYGDVALLAAALRDDTLARSLTEMYLLPLEDSRNGGRVLRQTLRAYLAAERNASSAAAALGVVRKTVESRLRTIEEKLGRSLHPCPAELEVALRLDELTPAPGPIEISIVG